MAKVVLKGICKRFGDVEAVKDINLEIQDQEFLVMVGPSGCGKTTTLRMIAGLEEISEGKIFIGDREVNDVPPKDRNIAMVFQSYALYPHMTVYENMAFGLRLSGIKKKEIDERVAEAAEVLDLRTLLHRLPKQLSGGQRQRVAVGRAIVRHPQVFLMDEPLSNLDAKLRVQMRAELQKLHRRLKTTVIYVTHDQVEAMTLGQRIAVILNGELQQAEAPLTVYDKPINRFVAGFVGSPPMNFVEGNIKQSGDDFYFEAEGLKTKILKELSEYIRDYAGKEVIFGIRPENIWEIGSSKWLKEDEKAQYEAKVDFRELMGSDTYIYVKIHNNPIVARVGSLTDVTPGSTFPLVFDLRKIHIFDPKTLKAVI
ncbi:glycerol-3-phosphate ABC transporter ATP-binding protein [candidate division WOR-1 bacterium RIFOXYA12_FULL_43_27]|uniref:Glycerol-3-phosphate ABC transporter ATP-binding protein n=1 Tax=candidate division WOR-1 bacterium RIFOXYC2_FULL_46_14 TaxID=1802587 RepID=A0A1F4U721_UNCSA|nr:MAG: glycerol-3-phosphate ABC transporter ATP-binding protein [candidate division WOR-1 bacterium RIFOXYA12_FULL_43_27]OGC19175.1 MAG: glycerol-3-phosphate ABC transporter ATP-binding protein [candidate division WOR-1 bacterium RIFOXYB2_FULL_46_45]OGC30164.1 MAG: glycerol-3-phosphate ABC transporter ATP-binding protein [candidate division WOR-1 bacterium RIFOXYA2_FULL_46_56]OGC40766.1 MAG: glycerol-3-phosphate ABC transporter ATP-binding protein [candidate division WOR-1 bacterium RIFOXYC2_FU